MCWFLSCHKLLFDKFLRIVRNEYFGDTKKNVDVALRVLKLLRRDNESNFECEKIHSNIEDNNNNKNLYKALYLFDGLYPTK